MSVTATATAAAVEVVVIFRENEPQTTASDDLARVLVTDYLVRHNDVVSVIHTLANEGRDGPCRHKHQVVEVVIWQLLIYTITVVCFSIEV